MTFTRQSAIAEELGYKQYSERLSIWIKAHLFSMLCSILKILQLVLFEAVAAGAIETSPGCRDGGGS